MIHFSVIADYVINVFRINDLADIINQIITEFLFYGINEGYLLIEDKIGVIG